MHKEISVLIKKQFLSTKVIHIKNGENKEKNSYARSYPHYPQVVKTFEICFQLR